MDRHSRITPEELFPGDLTILDDIEAEVLNSKVSRELDAEYLDSNPEPETEGRLEELTAELNRRDVVAAQPPHETGVGFRRRLHGMFEVVCTAAPRP